MLPPYLYGRFRRYQDDTDYLVQWLLHAATKTSFRPILFDSSRPPRPRYKNGTHITPIVREITLEELLRLAQVVATSGQLAPPAVILRIKRAIALHKDCAKKFLRPGEPYVGRSKFLIFLYQVLSLLEAEKSESSTASSDDEKWSAGGDELTLTDQLASLTIDEAEAAFHVGSFQFDIVAEHRVFIDRDNWLGQNPDSNKDQDFCTSQYFEGFCLFRDLEEIRVFIEQTWTEYQHETLNLMNASISTEAALQLAKDLIDEAAIRWGVKIERRGKLTPASVHLQTFMYEAICEYSGRESSPWTNVLWNLDTSDIADWCYLPAKTILDRWKTDRLDCFEFAEVDHWMQMASREQLPHIKRFDRDMCFFLSTHSEFRTMYDLRHSYAAELPVQDHITESIIEFIDTGDYTLWLAFATQIYLDIKRAMISNDDKPKNDLRFSGLQIKRDIETYWKTASSFPPSVRWPLKEEDKIRNVYKTIDTCVVHDAVDEHGRLVTKSKIKSGLLQPSHNFLSGHPVFCGLVMLKLTTTMQRIRLALTNHWGLVQPLAFLYNFVNHTDNSSLRWPDMDTFIKMHGEKRVFIGARPTSTTLSLSRVNIAAGLSRSAGNVEPFELKTPITNFFVVYYQQSHRINYILANVSKVLDGLVLQYSKTACVEDDTVSRLDALLFEWSRSHNIDALEMLRFFGNNLQTEESLVLFNHFSMHETALQLLCSIKAKQRHILGHFYDEAVVPDHTHIGKLVICIFRLAVAQEESSGEGIRVMSDCAKLMKPYLDKNGACIQKQLEHACKDKRPLIAEMLEAKRKGIWKAFRRSLRKKLSLHRRDRSARCLVKEVFTVGGKS